MELVLRNILLGISLAAPIGPSGVAIIHNGLSATILIAILMFHTSISLLSQLGRRILKPRSLHVISIAAGTMLLLFGARFAYLGISALVQA